MWQEGNAAFMRNWTSSYTASRAPDSPTKDRFDIASLPGGEAGIAATIGGNGYGVSRHSRHPQEATMLVRFLCGADEQLRRSRTVAMSPTITEVYKNAEVLAANPYYSVVLEVFNKGKATRPSTTARNLYPDVSRAYFEAVHEVLSGKKLASQAAPDLEKELTRLLKMGASGTNAGLDQKPQAGPR
jgi:trehalose/maltose transport system substrate-binding protein